MAKRGTHLRIIEKFAEQTGAGNDETLSTLGYGVVYYDCGGASRTGVIMQAGGENGETVTVVNASDAAETITFATDATSNVAGGTGIVIGQNEQRTFTWSASLSRWIPESTDSSTQAALSSSSHYVVAAGEHTTAGGDANETITVAGALATDIVLVTLHTAGSTPRTITTASASAGQIDVVMSDDPSTDHVLSYMVLRAV